jgi:hypothetical protein
VTEANVLSASVVEMNEELMERYRPVMRKFYLNKKADFK